MIKPTSKLGDSIMQLIAAYTNFKDPLGPGVAIQRKGAVRDFFVQRGSVSFEVHDKRERAFDVEIHVTPPSENTRRAVLSGSIHEAVPKVSEIQIHHVCPEWASPCRHEIAALLQLLKECEDNPNVILQWRGIEPDNKSENTPARKDDVPGSRKSTIQQLRDNMPGRFINFKEEANDEFELNPQMQSFFSFPDDSKRITDIISQTSISTKTNHERTINLDGENVFPVFEDAIETIKEFLSKH